MLFAVKNYTGEIGDETIVEKVDRIVRDWNERKREIDELYEELKSIAEIINEERKEKERLGLNEREYRILKLLRSHLVKSVEDCELVGCLKEILKEVESITFPRWYEKSEVVSEVSRKILIILIRNFRGKLDNPTKTKDDIVRLLKLYAERKAE